MKICMLIIVLISILNMKTMFGRGGDGGHGGGGYGGRGGNPGMPGNPGSAILINMCCAIKTCKHNIIVMDAPSIRLTLSLRKSTC